MVSYTGSLKNKLWKEEQRKRISTTKNRGRIKRAQAKWREEAIKWGHEHPKRGER